MCDSHSSRGRGWIGWLPMPEGVPALATGPWVDLSHRLSKSMPRAAVFPEPSFRRVKSLPEDPINVTEMQMVVHIGTHVDAPRHFFMDGPAFHEIPLDRLSGPGVVVGVTNKTAGEMIEPEDLARTEAAIRPGDIVALHTGWSDHATSHSYHDHPYLSPAAARWLADRGIKLLACDLPTPDQPIGRRPPGYDWPAHHILLSRGILIAENVTALAPLAGRRVEFAFLALNIEESDGAPARVLARPIREQACGR
jgi:kynurenine formamidase